MVNNSDFIGFSELKKKMKEYLEEENGVDYIKVEADTLEDALKDASLELSVPYKDLDYEVLIKGSNGFFGYNKRKWKVIAYKGACKYSENLNVSLDSEGQVEKHVSIDGKFFIRRTSGGIFLKVVPPKFFGKRVELESVLKKLHDDNIIRYSKHTVKNIVTNASSSYEKIAEFKSSPSENVALMVQIAENLMSVTIEFSKPGINGAEAFYKDIYNILKKYGVADKAILKDKVENFIDFPVYGENIEFAKGMYPIKGKDSYISFINNDACFNEYDEKNSYFRNVLVGEVLAEILPATKGINGYNVFGKVIEAEDGKNIEVLLGENTKREGNKIYSECSGYMTIVDSLISIHPVFFIEGDVGPMTGDVINNGMVFVKGGVLDGYNITARGGIEIKGIVGRGNLKTEGNIVLHSGVNGKCESIISAKGNVTAKFLENVILKSGGDVEVSRGIVNSHVSSKTKVLCIGKKSKIVGSFVSAMNEVRAYSIGSKANNDVTIEVGYDPEIKDLLDKFTRYLKKIKDRIAVVSKGILSFKKNLAFITDKSEKAIKIDNFNELINELKVLKLEINMVKTKHQSLKSDLKKSESNGSISIEYIAFSGVKLSIKNAYYELSRDYNNVTFIEDENFIKTVSYIPFESEKNKKNQKK